MRDRKRLRRRKLLLFHSFVSVITEQLEERAQFVRGNWCSRMEVLACLTSGGKSSPRISVSLDSYWCSYKHHEAFDIFSLSGVHKKLRDILVSLDFYWHSFGTFSGIIEIDNTLGIIIFEGGKPFLFSSFQIAIQRIL